MRFGRFEKIIYQPFLPCLWRAGKVYARGPMENGLREGPWTFWYLSGAKQMEGSFSRGRKSGPWVKYWENGNPQSRGEFDDGRMHGTWTDWFQDGAKAQETGWDSGKQTGPAILFDHKTGKALPGRKQTPEPGPEAGFTLMSDRDVAFAVRCAARSRMKRSWERLVGRRIGSMVEPWQAAWWLLLLPVFFRILDKSANLGLLAVPLAMVAASLAGVGLVALSLLHDHFTRPDIGT